MEPPGLGSGRTQPAMGGFGLICLPTSSHLWQSGGEVAGSPLPQNLSDSPRVIKHALVLGSQIPLSLPNLPNLLTQPFNQTPHRKLPNLNLHAWLL